MPTFSYVAMDKSGKKKKGTMEAPSTERVENQLKAEGMTPLTVKEATLLDKDINLQIGDLVSKRDLSVFCRQMVSLLKAGVPLVESIGMLGEQSENKHLKKALEDVRATVAKGESLASAMNEHKNIFPNMLINLIEAGEASGSMEISFERTATQFEKDAKISGAVKKAMIYPIVVVIVTIVVVIILLTFVVPTFADMFEDMGTTLPAITVAVMNVSEFIQSYWYLLLIIAAGLIVGYRMYAVSDSGRHTIDMIMIKAPLIGNLTTKSSAAKFARTLSTLTSAGISLMEALDITAKNMSNIHFKEAVIDARDEVAKGVTLSEPIKRSGVFPVMICNMIRIGEDTGDLEGMLDRSADYFEEETELATESLMAAMEPLIIIVLAVVCGTIIGSVMAPMAQMYSDLNNL